MKKYLLLILIIPSFLFCQSNFEYKKDFNKILKETKDKKSELYYPNLLERYNKVDSTLTGKEILSILIAYTDNENYKPYQDIEFGRNLFQLNEDKKYDEVIKVGEGFLATHPFDLKTLFETSYAYHKMNNQKIADDYLNKTKMIFEAMAYSGSGLTIDEPIFALNPADGQDFLRKGFGFKIGKMGSGEDRNGYFIDILEVINDQVPLKIYFIIPHAVKKMFE